jgi:hypothetical protein
MTFVSKWTDFSENPIRKKIVLKFKTLFPIQNHIDSKKIRQTQWNALINLFLNLKNTFFSILNNKFIFQ